jgi:hypothetical protein
MKRFKSFILDEATLSAAGIEVDRHTKKYITPYIGKKDTHTIKGSHEGIDSSRPITIHGHEEINGKRHAIVSQGGGRSIKVPFSKINKPSDIKVTNRGFERESALVDHLKRHGLMSQDAAGAGSTAGTDFTLENRRKGTIHPGQESDTIKGEVKADKTAAFGQITIHHTPELGWHIKDSNRAKRPRYAKHVDEHIISHLNKHHPNGMGSMETTASGKTKNITVNTPDLTPAEDYLKDHEADVVHVGSHGTYSVGEKDKTGIGLPRFKGKDGLFTVRQKRFSKNPSLTVQFQPRSTKSLEKSHLHLENDDHIAHFKNALGHN